MNNLPVEQVEVWDTENSELVVWGTTDRDLAVATATNFYETNGAYDSMPNDLREIISESKVIYCSPELLNEELWAEDKISKEYVEGWVPVMIGNL